MLLNIPASLLPADMIEAAAAAAGVALSAATGVALSAAAAGAASTGVTGSTGAGAADGDSATGVGADERPSVMGAAAGASLRIGAKERHQTRMQSNK